LHHDLAAPLFAAMASDSPLPPDALVDQP
jgi:hypothetical protein